MPAPVVLYVGNRPPTAVNGDVVVKVCPWVWPGVSFGAESCASLPWNPCAVSRVSRKSMALVTVGHISATNCLSPLYR